MHAGDQPEVQSLFRRHAHTSDELRRIDLADDVGKLRPGGEPFDISLGAWPPADRDFARRDRSDELTTDSCNRMIRIIVQRCVGMLDVWDLVVKESRERPHQAALPLSLLTEKEHVVSGDEGDIDFGNDRVFIADDAREKFLARGECSQEVVSNFLLNRFRNPATLP